MELLVPRVGGNREIPAYFFCMPRASYRLPQHTTVSGRCIGMETAGHGRNLQNG